MSFDETMTHIARGFEAAGVAVLVLGFVRALVLGARRYGRIGHDAAYVEVRTAFAQSLLLSLEILIAGDLIATVIVEPSLDNVAGLAVIVLIRTLLSFSLEIEISGSLPWRGKAGRGPEA